MIFLKDLLATMFNLLIDLINEKISINEAKQEQKEMIEK